MVTETPIRVGVIGVGYLGAFHAEKLSRIIDVELVGVVDTNIVRAQEIANKFGVTAFEHLEELLPHVDALSIATPSQTHFEIAKEVLLAEKDLLVEKPLTSVLGEAEELVGIASEKGKILQVGHIERFNAAFQGARPFITQPLFIESHRLGPYSPRHEPIDIVFDLMIHDLDLILSFQLGEVVSIDAVGAPVITPYIDIANARIKFSSGCIVNINASRVSTSASRKLRIWQPEGFLSIDFQKQQVNLTTTKPPRDNEKFPSMQTHNLDISQGDSLAREIASFINAIKTRRLCEGSGRDVLPAISLATQIRDQINQNIVNATTIAKENLKFNPLSETTQ